MAIYNETGSGGALVGGFCIIPDPVVIITSIDQIDLLMFRVQFRSQRSAPVTFRVYLAGSLVSTIPSTDQTGEARISVAPGTSPYLEILDDPNGIPHYAAPGSITLNWRQIGGAASYEIQQYNGSSWTTLQTQPEIGMGNALFLTPWLADDAEASFQVVPLDATGAAGTPISFSVFMVRHPDIPATTLTLNSNTTVTIASP